MQSTSSERRVVLVVDDEAMVRLLAVDLLEEAGHVALEAENAAEAMQRIAEHPEIDLLFTDINMPGGMDGLELAHIVAETRPHVRLIVTSGRERPGESQMPARGRFLPKPYTATAVVTLIAAVE